MTKKQALFFLPVAIAALAVSFWKVADPDVFWHLKAGEVMLEQGRLITQNTFSSVFPDHPWQDNEWLFQIILAGVYRGAGWAGVAAFKAAAVLAVGALLFAMTLAQTGRPTLAAMGATTALAIMQHRLTERPHLFSYVFLALTVLLVSRRERSPRGLWALPALFVLWSNIHPEVVFGLLYLGVVVAGEGVNSLTRRTPPSPAQKKLWLLSATCVGATLVNPWGYHLLTMPFSILRNDTSIIEFTVSTFRGFPSFWVFLLLTLLLVAVTRRPRDWAEILPVILLGVLAIRMQRVIPFFVIVATLYTFRCAKELSERGGGRHRHRVEAVCFLGAYGALIWALAFEVPGLYRWGWGIHEELYPVAAADVLAAEPWRGNLYNPYREGGYLLFRLHPALRVLQDGRGGAYPKEFVSRMNYTFTPQDLPRILSDYQIQVALFNLDEVNPNFNRARWGIVFWDDDYCLMARRDSPNKEILDRLEYRVFVPGADLSGEMDPEKMGALVGEMERNQRARRFPSASLANNIGFLQLRLRNLPQAESSFREAIRIDGNYGLAWANLGLVLMENGSVPEAQAAFTRAVQLDPRLETARGRLDAMQKARTGGN